MRNTYQGKFVPKNPHKYRGDINNIVFRSSWELRLMKFLDEHSGVLEYGSEEIIIPYVSPVDGKPHRYFPDFYIKVQESTGLIKKYLIEIKPQRQTTPPPKPQRQTQGYIREAYEYARNQAKWEAAREWCKDRGYEFKVLTEEELGIK